MKNKTLLLVIGMILLAAISRLIPHLPNFTPIGAIALFAGVYLQSRKLQLLVPIAALLVSDILLEFVYSYGFHSLMLYTYGSVLLIALMGSYWLKNKLSTNNVFISSLGSSIIFFFNNKFWSMDRRILRLRIIGFNILLHCWHTIFSLFCYWRFGI